MQILNPYNGVNWANQKKANFHTHTKLITINDVLYGSDGSLTQQEVIDSYYGADYKILAITDHDYSQYSQVTTYPWTIFERNPETLDMLAVQGKELSAHNHIGSLFSNLGHTDSDEIHSVLAIANNGGLGIMHHPGRYEETLQWYVNMFLLYKDTLVGLEAYNQGDKYPNDRKLWDLINGITIPFGVVVYGYSNDDMHSSYQRFRNYQFVLSDTILESDVRDSMKQGHTYFCYESGGSGDAKAPRITNISVNEMAKTINISADSGTVKWITENTVETGTGNTFDYNNFDKLFVRAEISNDFGVTLTQPFAFALRPFSKKVEAKYVKKSYGWVPVEKIFSKKPWGWVETQEINTR